MPRFAPVAIPRFHTAMNKFIRAVAAVSSVLLLSSCANWLMRQQCEKINWYQHGYDVAMSGKRLTGDERVQQCRKAEFEIPEQQLDVGFKAGMSNYCKPEIAYTTGKQGDFINLDLCDPGQATVLRQKHADGVKAYCAVGNGFTAGSSGKKYQNICPANMEEAFMKEYRRGRKSFLTAKIQAQEGEVRDLDNKISQQERNRTNLSFQRNMLPQAREVREKTYNAATGTYVETTKTEDRALSERERLDGEIRRATSQIEESQRRQDALRQAISADRAELATLE